jgi:hypothetical protein
MLTAGLIAMSALPLIDESVKAWLNEAAEY